MIDRMSRKSEEYMAVYRQIGELDAAICIASFRESLPLYCTPEFAEDRRVFMEGVCHPLIEDPVGNTLDLRRSCLITGSNASGKSTFIKAVSHNAIKLLEFAGFPEEIIEASGEDVPGENG